MNRRKSYLLTALVFCFTVSLNAQIAINLDGSLPDSSAMLELKSDSLGFLPPRMTEVQKEAIVNAKPGMIIYNTTRKSLDILTYNAGEGTNRWTSFNQEGVSDEARTFQVIYGDTMNDYFNDVIQTSDGGFLAVGTFEKYDPFYIGNTFHYIMAVKLNADGTLDTNFNKGNGAYGDYANCFFNSSDYQNNYGKNAFKQTIGVSVCETHNHTYLLSGYFYPGTSTGSQRGCPYFIKLNSAGKQMLYGFNNNGNSAFGNNNQREDKCYCGIETLDGGVVSCGYLYGSNNHNNARILKLDNWGTIDINFNQGYGNIYVGFSDRNSYLYKIIQNPDSSYVAVGNVHNDFLMVKLKPDGTPDSTFATNGVLIIRDTTNYHLYNQIKGYDLKRTDDGNYLVTGYCYEVPGQVNALNTVIFKITDSGTFDNTFGHNGAVIFGLPTDSVAMSLKGYSLALTPNGEFVVAGTMTHQSKPYSNNIFIAKFTANGAIDTGFGHSGTLVIGTDSTTETAYSVKSTKQGGFILAGSTTMNQSNGNCSGFIALITGKGESCANDINRTYGFQIYTGIGFKIVTLPSSLDHAGSSAESLPVNYHKGTYSSVCNQ